MDNLSDSDKRKVILEGMLLGYKGPIGQTIICETCNKEIMPLRVLLHDKEYWVCPSALLKLRNEYHSRNKNA